MSLAPPPAPTLADLELKRSEQRIAKAGIPSQFIGLDLSAYRKDGDQKALRSMTNFVEDAAERGLADGIGFALVGPPGLGKTMLASIVLQAVMRSTGATGAFVPLQRYITWMKNQFRLETLSKNGEREDVYQDWRVVYSKTQECYSTQMLVLDDVGKEHLSPFATEEFEFLLRSRYAESKPTIITSNLTGAEQWEDRYGPPLASFMHEAAPIITVTGKDYRKR